MHGLSGDLVAAAVARYCDALPVPPFDETAILERARLAESPRRARERRRAVRYALAAAAAIALALPFANVSGVIAGAEDLVRGFNVVAGKLVSIPVATSDLEHARADMPFVVIAPPAIPGAPVVAVREMTGRNPSVVFELRGAAGSTITISEDARRPHPGKTLFLMGGRPSDARGLAGALPPLSGEEAKPVLRAIVDGRHVRPIVFAARGTQIAIVCPPGAAPASVLAELEREMSR